MARDIMCFCEADVRTLEAGKALVAKGKTPKGVTFDDLLADAKYDARTKEIVVYVGGWEGERRYPTQPN